MPSNYSGDPTNYPTSVQRPSDGDAATASSVNAALEGLADRTAWLRSAIGDPADFLPAVDGDNAYTRQRKLNVVFVKSLTSTANYTLSNTNAVDNDRFLILVGPDVGSTRYIVVKNNAGTEIAKIGNHDDAVGIGAVFFYDAAATAWKLMHLITRPRERVWEFLTSGSWTSPITGYVEIEACGGGGGGGGGAGGASGSTDLYATSGGGGAGALYGRRRVAVTKGQVYSVVIGAGGSGGTGGTAANSGAAGGDGGDTTFSVQGGAELARFFGGGGGRGGFALLTSSQRYGALGGSAARGYGLSGKSFDAGPFIFANDQVWSYTDFYLPEGNGGVGTGRNSSIRSGYGAGQRSIVNVDSGGISALAGADSGSYRGGGGGAGGGAGPWGRGGDGQPGGAANNAGNGAPGQAGTPGTVGNANSGAGGGSGSAGGAGSGTGGAGGAGGAGAPGRLYVRAVF
jgi:hypothetical protein